MNHQLPIFVDYYFKSQFIIKVRVCNSYQTPNEPTWALSIHENSFGVNGFSFPIRRCTSYGCEEGNWALLRQGRLCDSGNSSLQQ